MYANAESGFDTNACFASNWKIRLSVSATCVGVLRLDAVFSTIKSGFPGFTNVV